MDSLSSLTSSLPSPTISTVSTQDLSIPVSNLLLCEYCSRSLAKISRCARCKLVSYCSQACQKKDWKVHKLVCGFSTGRKRLPDLPIEVLERILKYTFLRRSKLTPFSDPFHLNGTSFLLLLSKGFRELCLPFFYHTITFFRPSHYTDFFEVCFGPALNDLLKGKWEWVREICIVVGVEPPLNHVRRDFLQSRNGGPQVPGSRYTTSVWPTYAGNLEAVCLLDATGPLPIPDPIFDRLVLADVHQNERREECGILLEQEYFASGSPLSFDAWTKETFGRGVMDEISERIRRHTTAAIADERGHFFSVVVRYSNATTLIASTESLLYHDLTIQDALTFFHKNVELHNTSNPLQQPSSDSLVRMVCDFSVPVRPTTIQLVGFTSDLLAPFEMAMNGLVEERELWFEDWRVVWEKEDGSLVALPPVDSTGHVEPPKTERRKEQDNEIGFFY
ncbi:hypothetical protein BDY24DRAFT_385856 [Mrakia frigida]|uniref:zinc finger MYND domain-containing protein n=1 Tax=Mrakia frigida TaxID=29902 RepID=UPI003FCC2270